MQVRSTNNSGAHASSQDGEVLDHVSHLRWVAARIPMQLRFKRLDDLPYLSPALREEATAFVATFPSRYLSESSPQEDFPRDQFMLGRGMTLVGPPGRGKTSLACAILTEVSLAYAVAVLFAPLADYMYAWSRQYGPPDEENRQSQRLLARCDHVPLLVLDDVGKEHLTASNAAADQFDRLVRARHRRSLPTILTSNLGPKEWEAAYGSSMTSFMHDAFPPKILDTADLRRRNAA